MLPAEDAEKAVFCFANGFDTAALIYSVKCIEQSNVHSGMVYTNLSTYYEQNEMYNEAELCKNKVRSRIR